MKPASGWQQMLFTTPVAITANTTYVISYFSSAGYYAITNPYFTTATTKRSTLTALANGTDGGNGVYIYTAASAFPNSTLPVEQPLGGCGLQATIAPDTTPPTISLTAPAAGTVTGTVSVTASGQRQHRCCRRAIPPRWVALGAEVTGSPYTLSWNTTTATNGAHTPYRPCTRCSG